MSFVSLAFMIVILMILSLFANFVAQRALPTAEHDDTGQRLGYRMLVQIIGYGTFGSIVGVIYFFSVRDSLLRYSDTEFLWMALIGFYFVFVVAVLTYHLWPKRKLTASPESKLPPLPSFLRSKETSEQKRTKDVTPNRHGRE
jgi:hypothetical protein